MKKASLALLAVTLSFLVSLNAIAACAPQVTTLITQAPYSTLNAILTPAKITTLTTKLSAVKDSATYNKLLVEAVATADMIANGRVVITLPDGTVVVDTAKGAANTFANFDAKKINENHNTRISILDAQLYDCGVGLETKTSTTTDVKEVYLAKRLGNYLNSAGTVRLSHK